MSYWGCSKFFIVILCECIKSSKNACRNGWVWEIAWTAWKCTKNDVVSPRNASIISPNIFIFAIASHFSGERGVKLENAPQFSSWHSHTIFCNIHVFTPHNYIWLYSSLIYLLVFQDVHNLHFLNMQKFENKSHINSFSQFHTRRND